MRRDTMLWKKWEPWEGSTLRSSKVVSTRTRAPAIWVRSSTPGSKEKLLSDGSEGEATFPALAAGGGLVAVTYEAEQDRSSRVLFRVVDEGRK